MSGRNLHYYPDVTRAQIEMAIKELTVKGVSVTGNNPWHIDTGRHGVWLQAEWSGDTSTLVVSITSRNWYVPDELVWSKIDSLVLPSRKPEIA